MDNFWSIFALALCLLLVTAEIGVKADEEDPESQETGWTILDVCMLSSVVSNIDNWHAGGVACYL